MADHPFDDVAVEAAAKAIFAKLFHLENPDDPVNGWNAGMSGGDDMEFVRPRFIDYATSALTAAFKSMKDRGMAREGVATEKRGVWLARSQDHPGSNCMFVTIIRHKENGA